MITETGVWGKEEAETGHIFSEKVFEFMRFFFIVHNTIYDLGCGKGTYLSKLQKLGYNVHGFEGCKDTKFDLDSQYITIKDLTEKIEVIHPIEKGNVICLEVIEHIPKKYQSIIFDNINTFTLYGNYAIISCAIPGQGGMGHINCLSNVEVIYEMEKRNFKFMPNATLNIREDIEDECAYFRDTLLIFKKMVKV